MARMVFHFPLRAANIDQEKVAAILRACGDAKRVEFKRVRDEAMCRDTIIATDPDLPDRKGIAHVSDVDFLQYRHQKYQKQVDLLLEACRFAAWQLVHNDETEEEDEE